MLAKILSKPSNVIILDEPTNDLDIETLEVLEDFIIQYPGTILLVSHDRAFINNIATSTLVFEDNQVLKEYIGGYDDWISQREITPQAILKTEDTSIKPKPKKRPTKEKLSFKEQKMLDQLPEQIEAIESQIECLQNEMQTTNFYQKSKDDIKAHHDKLEQLEYTLDEYYTQWQTLSEKEQRIQDDG